MEIKKLIDCLNRKISGLHTVQIDTNITKQAFTNRILFKYTLYRYDYPEGTRITLQKFESTDIDMLEADVVEFLFDILISGIYETWKNFDLVEKEIKEIKEWKK